jgi:hypothetical protein
MKRVFELFDARGFSKIYTVKLLTPSKLNRMNKEDFYDRLLPEARRLRARDVEAIVARGSSLFFEGE